MLGFSEKVIEQTLINLETTHSNHITFFDRGLPDTLAYLDVAGISERLNLDMIIKNVNYHSQVFITPFWDAIYQTDSERKESKEEALSIEKALINTYESLGFEIIKIDPDPIEQRTEMLLSILQNCEIV